MSIGLMDMDMNIYTLVPFNLEIMKLSSYYKKKNQIVSLSPTFCPDRYTKFFVRKDYNDKIYPPKLAQIDNVEYGGNAFTNNIYVPLPIEIEKSKPDSSIYTKMQFAIENAPGATATKKQIYRNMMEAEHCRISLDGKTIWEDYDRQFHFLQSARHLMIHDYNLGGITDSYEIVKKLMDRARKDGWATRLGMKYPVVVNTGQDLINWCSFKPNSIFYSLEYDGIIEDDAFNEWVGRIKEKSIYKQLDYYVTKSQYTPNDFIKFGLPKIFKQVIISRSYRIFFTLKYEDEFFFDPMWYKVIDLINFYHNSYRGAPISDYLQKIPNDTLFDFANATINGTSAYYGGKMLTRNQIREIFSFVRENHYELFKMFYECKAGDFGGKL